MLVDVDHLLANPIYDPTRCSIGFHPLHSFIAIMMYFALCFIPKYKYLRIIALGLMIHMVLDSIDCQMINGVWFYSGCITSNPIPADFQNNVVYC